MGLLNSLLGMVLGNGVGVSTTRSTRRGRSGTSLNVGGVNSEALDINHDGRVDLGDLQSAQQAINTVRTEADVNGDGKINAQDLAAERKKILGK